MVGWGVATMDTDAVVVEQPVAVWVKVKVTEPAEIPVATPAFVMMARELLLLVHVPPVVGVNCAMLPVQIETGAVRVGGARTETGPEKLLVACGGQIPVTTQ
jgi:hypothetical protein